VVRIPHSIFPLFLVLLPTIFLLFCKEIHAVKSINCLRSVFSASGAVNQFCSLKTLSRKEAFSS
jgi:hypothetical protein